MKVCPPKTPVGDRELLSIEDAGEIADVFEILSNCTRLRLLHAMIKSKELNVGQLSEMVGMKKQAVSNQLRRLSDSDVVEFRT